MKLQVGKTYLVSGANKLKNNDQKKTEWIVELLSEPDTIFVYESAKMCIVNLLGYRHFDGREWGRWHDISRDTNHRIVHEYDIVAELTPERPRQAEYGGYFVKEWL